MTAEGHIAWTYVRNARGLDMTAVNPVGSDEVATKQLQKSTYM